MQRNRPKKSSFLRKGVAVEIIGPETHFFGGGDVDDDLLARALSPVAYEGGGFHQGLDLFDVFAAWYGVGAEAHQVFGLLLAVDELEAVRRQELVQMYLATIETNSNSVEECDDEREAVEEVECSFIENSGKRVDEKTCFFYEQRIKGMLQLVNNQTEKQLLLIMLLSAIDYFHWFEHTYGETNMFPLLASWEGDFLNLVKKQLKKIGRESTMFSTPFIHLGDWSFWRLMPHDNKQVNKGRAIKTFDNLQQTYDGVEIDQEFAMTIRNSNSREKLKETLLFYLSNMS